MITTRKITFSAIVIAMYITLMLITQSFAFGQYQVRLATALYALSYIYPFLIIPFGISNLLSNALMGGLGPLDVIGGTIVGITTSSIIFLIRKFRLNKLFVILVIVLCPGLIVPIWLSFLLNLPYKVLAISICIGQVIPGIVGFFLISHLERLKVLSDVNLHFKE